MNSMNENDDDGTLGNIPMAAVGGAGGGGGTTLPHDGAAFHYASWNEFGSNHAHSITNNNFNSNGGDARGMMASSTTNTPFMDDLQLNDHPMVSFSDTGGMGMAVAGGTKYDESNDYYGDSSPQQQQTTANGNDMMMRPTVRNGDSPNSSSHSNSIRSSGEHSYDELNFHPDLPFLVTHWLSTFVPPPAPTNTASTTPFSSSSPRLLPMPANNATANKTFENQRQEAIQLIRHHASSLAHAFQTLGAFGVSSSSNCMSSNVGTTPAAALDYRPTTYADMTRKYSHLVNVALPSSTPEILGGRMMDGSSFSRSGSSGHCLDRNGNRLGALLGALVCASAREEESSAVQNGNKGSSSMPWSLLEASYEGSIPSLQEDSNNSAIVPVAASSTTTSNVVDKRKMNVRSSSKSSAFGHPGRKVGEHTLSSMDATHKASNEHLRSSGDIITSSMSGMNAHNAGASSRYCAASIRAAAASRTQQKLRSEVHTHRREMECNRVALEQSTKKQSEFMEKVCGGIGLGEDGGIGGGIDSELNNPHRVAAHLNTRRMTLQSKYDSTKTKLAEAEWEARQLYKESTSIRRQYYDAYKFNGQPSYLHQMLRDNAGPLNLGYGPSAHTPGRNNLVLPSILSRQYHPRHKMSHVSQTRLSVLKSRMSYAQTINCHLIYPVYCLKFDKTGKYFITGADDQVAKVFHLGAGPRKSGSATTMTMFGEQSSTLPFNYGANVRGAVLVCSLRGHAGVISDLDVSSDNSLLATASGDGDVRIWDLKDGWPVATLRGHKGGANWVSWSLLSPYRLVTCGDDGYARMWDVRGAAEKRFGIRQRESEQNDFMDHDIQTLQPGLVQLPVQQENSDVLGAAIGINANANIVGLELQRPFGEFVFNDHIDDGVTLMASLQHSSVTTENEATMRLTRTGPGKEVKVMCIARCPLGGHFATGSDDGVGRVWIDDDDWLVERQDCEFDPDDDFAIQHSRQRSIAPRVPPRERLLASLRGHTKPITEIKYSSAGDRILTASEDDGNVCIWSGFHTDAVPSRFSNISKLCIQLCSASHVGHGAKVRCDGVAWMCDDMKVVTSQSILANTNSLDIIPESHMLHVWDSHSGKCLMGISGSHSSISIALAPHPFLPSVVALAGLDGCVNVWDLDRGDCFYTHTNTLLHGPVEPISDRGKQRGCIEVQFSPDGLNLVVTDDSGRATILDTQLPAWLRTSAGTNEKATLSEQYFANDYYELVYDENGNCIEKGSEQPPHLAPGGVRCSHEGVPVPEMMRDLFVQLKGPLPLPCNNAVRCRNEVRSRGTQSRLESSMGRKYSFTHSKRVVASRYESTVILTKDGTLVQHEIGNGTLSHSASSTAGFRNPKKSKPANTSLSSRYHWIDFNDLADSEEDGEDQLDNDYHGLDASSDDDNSSPYRQRGQSLGGRRGSRRTQREDEDSPEHRGRRGSRRTQRETVDEDSPGHRRPARASSRRATQHEYHELSSDDDHLQEMMSAHTKPSGKYVNDWEVSRHMFKLPRGGGSLVHRSWLHRTSYQGRKCYCPQVGDSVVYIPKAHDATLRRFPINDYSPPWKSWPTATSWPVVLCKITHVRYRFPYEMNYKSRHQDEKLMGVSAILTLEIVGVPSQTRGRTLPWPAPTFISPADRRTRFGNLHQFDVTLFVSDEDEFIIPEYIYSWRLKELERAISNNDGNVDGLPVTVYCPPDSCCNGASNEDADYLSYAGRLVKINETSEDEFHFSDSGYLALSLAWDTQDSENKYDIAGFSVWSINIAFPSCDAPIAPTMGEEVTNAVREALRNVIRMDDHVNEWFFEQVDTSKFTDYLDMVEVPIHLSLIQMRLRSNYYTNKLSVIADMEQLMENCYKYNDDDNDFYDLACQMYERFKSLVDAIEEPPALDVDESTAVDEINDRNELAVGNAENSTSSFPGAQTNVVSGEGAINVDENQSLSQSVVDDSDMANNASRRRPVRGRSKPAEDGGREVAPQIGTLRSSERRSTRNGTITQPENASTNDVDSESSSEDESDESDEEDAPNTRASASRSRSRSIPAKGKGASDKGNGLRRMSARAKGMPAYADKSSEEELCSEGNDESENVEDSDGEDDSDSDVSTATRNTRNRNTRKMPSRAQQNPNKTTAVQESGALRISLRAKSKPTYAEKDSDEDDESIASGGGDSKVSAEGKVSSSRRAKSTGTSRTTIEHSRRGTSSRARRKTDSLEDVGSRKRSKDERDGAVSAAKENSRNGRPSRASSRSSYFEKGVDANPEDHQLSGRWKSPRAKSRNTYADIDSYSESRSEDESEDDSSSEEETIRNTRKRGLRQSGVPAKKRARTQRQSLSIPKYPELEKWGPIAKRKIFTIGTAILGRLRELDTLDLFSEPVLKTHPNLAAAYNEAVKIPMDFRTIEKDRMRLYTHIADLQDDLILTFRNCCEFNGENTEYYNYAIVIWKMLDDVYNDVLQEKY